MRTMFRTKEDGPVMKIDASMMFRYLVKRYNTFPNRHSQGQTYWTFSHMSVTGERLKIYKTQTSMGKVKNTSYAFGSRMSALEA